MMLFENERNYDPREKMVLLSKSGGVLIVWHKFNDGGDYNGEKGVCCAMFRNESVTKSSRLIREAVTLARKRWPGERFYTYVNPEKIESSNRGYCFIKAGWNKCGVTKGGLIVLELVIGEVTEEKIKTLEERYEQKV